MVKPLERMCLPEYDGEHKEAFHIKKKKKLD